MKLTNSILMMLLLTLIAGCASSHLDTYCIIAKPIYLEKKDLSSISPLLSREVLLHNETYHSLCGRMSHVTREEIIR